MAKQIKITIQSGKVHADYSGFIGTACTDLDEKLRPGGAEVDEETFKNGGAHCQVDSETLET